MHTYRGLHPQIIPVMEKALSKGTISVDDVRLFRTVRKDQQLGAQRLESMSGRSQGSDFILRIRCKRETSWKSESFN